MNKYVKLALLGILIIGFYLRIAGVLTNSFAYTYDVGRDMLQVQQIVESHKLPLIGQTTGLGGLFYGPWWYYILTPAFIISSGNPQGIAAFMVLIGMSVILLAYLLGRKLSGNRMGLALAAFTSFSPVMISLSAQIWNPNIAPLFVLLTLIGLFSVHKKNHEVVWYLVFGLLLGLLLDTEIVFGVLYILSFIIMYFFIQKRFPSLRNLLLLIIGFFIILAPRIFFEVRHNFIMTRTLIAPGGVKEAIFSGSGFFSAIPDRAIVLFKQYADTVANGNVVIAGVFLILSIYALIIARKSKNKLFFKYFLSSFIVIGVFLIGAAFFARAIWGHYLVGLPVFYLLSLACMVEGFFTRGKLKIISIGVLIIAGICMINPVAQIQSFRSPLWEGDAAVYRNQTAVVNYIFKDAHGRKFSYIAYTPVVYDYTYQYLFSWYGKKYYGYVPDPHSDTLFYVIIEPDHAYPVRIINWLKVREHDGKIVKEQVVKGGIKVQTRTR